VKAPPWLLAPAGSVLESGRTVELDPDEARHAASALRLRPGDPVTLADGAGSLAAGAIAVLGKGRAEVDLDEVRMAPRPAPNLELAVGVLAGSAMDLVIQKSVELGVERIVPVCSSRSQLSVDRAGTRLGHWRRVALQAHKQCRRAWFMSILDAATLDELVEDLWDRGGIVADRDGRPADTLVADTGWRLLVGPEGGFDPAERRRLDEAGWPKVCLGRYVLRAETAAIAAAVVCGLREGHEGDSIDG
jgi:16S rRNA (uracil1498-N3)-methyltransferase